ncbi:MAG: TIGR03960 family B12-binding radical SAM protein [Oligoflexia bacterium]|nr:TIGR03960 family B12-binding radical SAM protein [Oligoflexia bacterium]
MRVNPYAKFLSKVQKPARYIGGEHLVVKKDDKDHDSQSALNVGVNIKVALCFPELYEIGMGHLGFKILYQQLNKEKDVYAERVFAPWIDMEKELRERNLPLVSLESFRPLDEFDVVGFSLQYELTYTNILTMLSLGRISIYSKDRKENEPIVIAGGPCASHPEPLAPFIDIFLVGDGEDIFLNILRHIHVLKNEKAFSREEILREFSNNSNDSNNSNNWQKKGVYVPRYFSSRDKLGNDNKIVRHRIEDLNKYPFPIDSPIPHLTTIFDKFSIEIARGCSEGCRFCFSGMSYRPVRERNKDEIMNAVREGLKIGGISEASLTSLSTADYSELTPLVVQLVDELKEQKAFLGISSLRAYGICDIVLEKMASLKDYSLTFAPEAGSERMRRVINKNITEEEILANARKIFSLGWKKMKLYFMIGLPFETDEDVLSIMELAKKIKEEGRVVGAKNPEITVSVSSFVPKPHTPFQWSQMNSLEELKRKQELLWNLAKKYKLKYRKHDASVSIMEALFARGDSNFSKVIFDSWESGARFDGWEENFDFNLWMENFKKNGIDIDNNLLERNLNTKLPWSHIDVGIKESFLKDEWLLSQKEISTKPCAKFNCHNCGIDCDLEMIEQRRENQLKNISNFSNNKIKILNERSKEETKEETKEEIIIGNQNKKNLNQFLSREKRGENVGYRYRLKFAKVGPLSFISHLDLQKVIARIFKRAKIATLYSEGFNLRPLLSFGPALPIGLHSLSEYLDVRTSEIWINHQEILKSLQKYSEEGLIFYDIVQIDKKDTSIQEAIREVDYLIAVSDPEIQEVKKILDQQSIQNLNNENIDFKGKEFIKEIKLVSNCKNFIDDSNALTLLEKQINLDRTYGIFIRVKYEKGISVRPNDLIKFFVDKLIFPEGIIKIHAYF